MGALKLIAANEAVAAPPWEVTSWLNTRNSPRLEELRGRVVVLHAFQMLCPGCVMHGIPQAQKIHALFPREAVCVIGLHSVFEHHDAMRPVSLRAFLHEYRVGFPVGIDEPGDASPIPRTMAAYGMRGTPTLALIDGMGRLRLHTFGRPDDMAVGAAVASLVAETANVPNRRTTDTPDGASDCDAVGCRPKVST